MLTCDFKLQLADKQQVNIKTQAQQLDKTFPAVPSMTYALVAYTQELLAPICLMRRAPSFFIKPLIALF
jgi:hypothetical protein